MQKLTVFKSASLLIVISLLMFGCAGTIKNMRGVPVGSPEVVPEGDNSVVVFMRPG